MDKLKKIWEAILKIWKDPVWSKVISAGIILLIATIWARYSNYSWQEIYDFFILLLTYKLPIFVFLSIIGLYFLTKLLIRLFKKKIDPIWDEQVGNYKFKELYQILSNQNFPVETVGMSWSGRKPPEEDLLTMFHSYITFFNRGLNLDDNLDDGGYLYGVLAPKLVGYGLLDKIETKNLQIDVMDIKYQTSEIGQKFYALLEKTLYLKSNKKSPNR
ncbi:MAG: hypothetical protein KF781_08655 [Chitinophagaceae bacterium]|nr:hypothetical protein [Chitinophagaceae bacterium]